MKPSIKLHHHEEHEMKLDVIWVEPVSRQVMTSSMTVLDFVPLNTAQTRYEALCAHPFLSL